MRKTGTRACLGRLGDLIPEVASVEHLLDIGILSPEMEMVEVPNITGMEFYYGAEKFKYIGPPKRDVKPGFIRIPEHVIGFRNFTGIGYELSKVANRKTLPKFIPELSIWLDKELRVRLEKIETVPA